MSTPNLNPDEIKRAVTYCLFLEEYFTKDEIYCYNSFLFLHKYLRHEDCFKYLQDENPELYDKLLKIGGYNNGSTTV